MKTKGFFYSFFFVFLFYSFTTVLPATVLTQDKELSQAQKLWKALPVQHKGRIKPLDTFARESLSTIYGKDKYQKRSAVDVILSWLLVPDFWEQSELFLVEKEIKKSLGLNLKTKHFSLSDLKSSEKLTLQLIELKALRQKKEPLDSYFKSLSQLENRIFIYEATKRGLLLRFVAQPEKQAWLSLPEITGPTKQAFENMLSNYIQLVSLKVLKNPTASGQNPKPQNTGQQTTNQSTSNQSTNQRTSTKPQTKEQATKAQTKEQATKPQTKEQATKAQTKEQATKPQTKEQATKAQTKAKHSSKSQPTKSCQPKHSHTKHKPQKHKSL